jgi:methionyl aminopeptidase
MVTPCLIFTHIRQPCGVPPSQVICHGIPDRRPLQDGDIVNVDVTACYKGYHGDLNETFVVGAVDEESRRLIRVTAEVRCCIFLNAAHAVRAAGYIHL